MKKNVKLILISMLILNNLNAQNDVKSSFLLKWENSKNYLLEIASKMPEDTYNYKPTEQQMNFQEQLLHIRENMVWLSETYFTSGDFLKSKKVNPTTKEALIKELEIAFNNVYEIIKNVQMEDLSTEVDFFAGPKSKLQILNLLQDHVSHHRGQLIVYLNLVNVKPPKYTGW
ncbi:MAG: DinB family protein [Lutibacter sp.]|uniref:DinB family protein n=1 Tax=Lutibacter sp. TaxID=1925666 RepID=UPI0017DF5AF2|nr:DinB family protein [Lutibacter sp.]MBT8317689.1 DinB family protein [Lutibacter sp.]NNJ58547.1 DinB family protein [Lutibacter sp.]